MKIYTMNMCELYLCDYLDILYVIILHLKNILISWGLDKIHKP